MFLLFNNSAKGYVLKNDTSSIVKLNLCEDLVQKCNNLKSQMISYDSADEKTCTRLAGSIVSNNNTWKLIGKKIIFIKIKFENFYLLSLNNFL